MTGDVVVVYSNANEVNLQLRREVPTQEDILDPSFKTAVALTNEEALKLAHELLTILVRRGRKNVASDSQDGQEEEGAEREA